MKGIESNIDFFNFKVRIYV